MTIAQNQPQEAQLRQNERKWTRELMAEGWTAWPSVFLEYQRELGLTPTHVNILLQIARCWWEPASMPFRSKKQIARAIGVSEKTVQRHVSDLVDAGLIERIDRFDGEGAQRANAYAFKGLIEKGKPYAEAMRKRRLERTAAKAERQARKPGLRRVK